MTAFLLRLRATYLEKMRGYPSFLLVKFNQELINHKASLTQESTLLD